MPSHIAETRPVRRAVTSTRGAALVMEIMPEGTYWREKGRRTRYLLPHGTAYQMAVQLFIAQQRKKKALARAAKRLMRRAR